MSAARIDEISPHVSAAVRVSAALATPRVSAAVVTRLDVGGIGLGAGGNAALPGGRLSLATNSGGMGIRRGVLCYRVIDRVRIALVGCVGRVGQWILCPAVTIDGKTACWDVDAVVVVQVTVVVP